MKKIVTKTIIGAVALVALILLIADVPGNMVAFVATKIAGAALLLASGWALGKFNPEILEEEI